MLKNEMTTQKKKHRGTRKKKNLLPRIALLAVLAAALGVGGFHAWRAYSVYQDDKQNGFAKVEYAWPDGFDMQAQFLRMADGSTCFDAGFDAAQSFDGIAPGEKRELLWYLVSTGTRSVLAQQTVTVSALAKDNKTVLDAGEFSLLDETGAELTDKTVNKDGSVTYTLPVVLLNGSKQVEKEVSETQHETKLTLRLSAKADADPTGRGNYYKCAVTMEFAVSAVAARKNDQAAVSDWPSLTDYQTLEYSFATAGLTEDSLLEQQAVETAAGSAVQTVQTGTNPAAQSSATAETAASAETAAAAKHYNLRMSLLGDSITGGYGTTKNYGNFLSEEYGLTIYNYGIDGSSLTTAPCYFDKTVELNPMVERYDALTESTDVIFVWGGTNDQSLCNAKQGYASSTDTDTICGALREIISGLEKAHPEARAIIVATPLQRMNMDYELRPYANSIKNMVKTLYRQDPDTYGNLYYFDAFNDDVLDFTLRIDKLMPDGLHPDADGQRLIARQLMQFMLDEEILTDEDLVTAATPETAAASATAESAATAEQAEGTSSAAGSAASGQAKTAAKS